MALWARPPSEPPIAVVAFEHELHSLLRVDFVQSAQQIERRQRDEREARVDLNEDRSLLTRKCLSSNSLVINNDNEKCSFFIALTQSKVEEKRFDKHKF